MAAAKVPYPRQLQTTETLDSLTHWRSHVRNYFRRDENLKDFFSRTCVWDPGAENYGFVEANPESAADNLEGLLDTIAGFMPGPYLTAQITKQATCMNDVFQIIWKHYDVDPSPSSFLDFDNLSLAHDERYIDLFYRMQYHAEQHLLQKGDLLDGKQVPATETLSTSHKNLIALNWLKAIDKNLVGIVKLEKHKELKEGNQLCLLIHDIAKNIDEWLRRHGHSTPKRPTSNNTDAQVRNVRFDRSFPRGTGRGNYRGNTRGNYRPAQNNSSNSNYNPRHFCPGCNYLAQELKLEVNFKHLPANCPRKQSTLRLLHMAEQELAELELDPPQDEPEQLQEDDYPHQDGSGILRSNISLFNQNRRNNL